MAAPFQDPRTVVKVTTRLWSDEVGLVDDIDQAKPFDPAYQFNVGGREREFVIKEHYKPDNPT